jgi:hypothetical protein
MTIKLSDGFEVNIDERRLNDWRLLKLIRGIDKGDSSLSVDVMEILLGGEENLEALENHLEVDGITTIDAMGNALREIIEAASELKNS